MRLFRTEQHASEEIEAAIARPFFEDNPELENTVKTILDSVRRRKDEAVLEYTRRFDSSAIESLQVTPAEFEKAQNEVSSEVKSAIEAAASRIRAFHEAQLRQSWWMNSVDGGLVGQTITPLRRVGAYVPGGKAVYPSSVLMNCIPALVAGVEEVILCVPPLKDGSVPSAVLAAASHIGIKNVFKIGGAQAIAAMAYGTETVPTVDKIVGPGNVYVTLAKRMVWGTVGVDMLAGPSEVCVVADESANPKYAAADLLVQVEHAEDCSAFLLSPSEAVVEQTLKEIEEQIQLHPRKEILKAAMAHSTAIVTRSLDEAIEWSNKVAPEHMSLMVENPMSWLPKVRAAGAALLGDYSPQSLGDYAAGPSHTLPTSGAARFASPLNVDDFVKKTSVIYYDKQALENVSPIIETFGSIEGFDAHAYAAKARLEKEN